MNTLTLEFDLSEAGSATPDSDSLRHELSVMIDEALKKTGQGYWSASKVKDDRLQIKCTVHEPELARSHILHALSKHWIMRHLVS